MNLSKLCACITLVFSACLFVACSSDSSSGTENVEVSDDESVDDEEDSSSSEALVEDDESSSSKKGKSSSSKKNDDEDVVSVGRSSSSAKKDSAKVWANLLNLHGGFYPDSVKIAPAKLSDGITLRCSSDGSVPTDTSKEFKDTLTIDSNIVVRCVSFKGKTPVDTATETFFIDEHVNMPVVAISVSPRFFERNYVYDGSCAGRNPATCRGNLLEDIEYPVHVEFFEKGSSTPEKTWEINAGISLMGQWSRTYAKKSVSVSMRSEYQDGRLKYPLFTTRPKVKKFKAFNLRNNGNRFVGDYFEDAMASSLLEGSGVDYQRSRQVVVFYNGKYYGIHDMREKLNEHFVETNYGIDSKIVDVVKHVDEKITASGGTTTDYENMLQFIASSDFSGSKNKNYEKLKTMMDIGNYADYMAAQIYYRNGDWPNNNVRAWKSPTQPWKFMVFDLDHGFGWPWCVEGFEYYYAADGESMFDWIRQGGNVTSVCYNSNSEKCFHTIFVKLMENDDFRRLFVNHAAVMYDYYLNSANVAKAVERIVSTMDPADVARDMEKFPRNYGLFFDENGSNFEPWAQERDAVIWGEYQEEFGLDDPITVSIAATGDGSVLVDGMKLPSATYKGKFLGGNQMELLAVPSGSAVFSAWEDGSTDNPRLITPKNGKTYTAKFK